MLSQWLRKGNWIMWIGLASIALGTGGIKPCRNNNVSAFGGDQFGPGQEKQLAKYFSFFYMAINAGGFVTTFVTPIMREDVHCFGRDSCFPLAFGIPAVLMLTALVLFVSGRYITSYVMVQPQKESVLVNLSRLISLSRKLFSKGPKRDHWLDYSDDKFDTKTIADIKAVLRVLLLYVPLPIFWALYNQQGSRWTLQATKMDGKLGSFRIKPDQIQIGSRWTLQATKMDGKLGSFRIKPDQIQIVNSIFILLFIPLFDYIIYPLFAKCGMLKKPLQRMVVGGVLAGLAFAICGFYQITIEKHLPPTLSGHSIHMSIVNGLNSKITVKNNLLFPEKSLSLEKYNIHTVPNVDINELTSKWLTFNITLNDETNIPGCLPNREYSMQLSPSFQRSGILFITESICDPKNVLKILEFNKATDLLAKPEGGGALAAIAYNIRDSTTKPALNIKNDAYITFKFKNSEFTEYFNSTADFGHPIVTGDTKRYEGYVSYKKELNVHKGGAYELLLLDDGEKSTGHEAIKGMDFLQGGAYVSIGKLAGVTHNLVEANSLSVYLQIVQYAMLTAGEIMFSITGLEFSYSQAPVSMKSLVSAAWCLTVSFGDLIIFIISSSKLFEKQSSEFFFFAGLIVADMIVFAIIAYFYKPYQNDQGKQDDGIKVDDNDSNSIDEN
ncbi:unnamed protein product, partial [Medioppia subpectinata]